MVGSERHSKLFYRGAAAQKLREVDVNGPGRRRERERQREREGEGERGLRGFRLLLQEGDGVRDYTGSML